MPDSAVVNASPLIFLSKAGLLHFLQLAGNRVIVPAAVAMEIRQRETSDPTVQALEQTQWLEIVETPPVPSLIQAWDLGPGEASVLTYAHVNARTVAVIDDLLGRRCAEALKIPVNGTLGLVLIAKKRGVIPAARPVLDTLRQAGMYLSDQVVSKALMLVGE